MTVPTNVPAPDYKATASIREVRERFDASCRAIEAATDLAPSDPVLLGCSAGGDSMALLDLMAHRAMNRRSAVRVAHFDHAQRPESSAEAEFVRRRCEATGVEFRSARWSAAPAPQDEGSMREARLEWFAREMTATNSRALLLAHQADDRAETFLMRLLRGSGPTGLASIRTVEQLRGMIVVRPLLEFRRDELRDHLRARGLDWREDPSNENERYDRVWVRRRLLPLMSERMGADVAPRIVRASRLMAEESRALGAACELLLAGLEEAAPPNAIAALRLDDPMWIDAPTELRAALLRQWLWKLRQGVHPPGYETVREALGFAERGATGTRHRTIELIDLVRDSGRLIAFPPAPAAPATGS